MERILQIEKEKRARLGQLDARLLLHSSEKALKDPIWLEQECGYVRPSEEELVAMRKEKSELEDSICDHEILLLMGIDPVYFDYNDKAMSPVFLGKCLESNCYKIVRINSFVANQKTIIRPNDSRLFKQESKLGLVLPGERVNTYGIVTPYDKEPFEVPEESDIDEKDLLYLYYTLLSGELKMLSSQYAKEDLRLTGNKFVKHLGMKCNPVKRYGE